MRFLRTNTAVIITVGPFLDKSDGVTLETALTITNEKITLTADTDDGSAPTNILDNVTGATSGTANDLNYITGNDAGMMQLELSAANVNRLGRMFLSITDAANHVPVFHEFMVMPALVYDTFFASSGGATFPAATLASTTNITSATGVDITKILGTAISTPATAGILDVNVKNIDNDAASASGTVTFPNATLASTTNITAGTVTTATNVTTVNGLAAGVITAASIASDAITDAKVAADVTIASVTGAVGSVTGNVGGNVVGSVGSVTGLTAANLDVAVSTRLATAGYTAPDNTSITGIKAKTDSLTFTAAG